MRLHKFVPAMLLLVVGGVAACNSKPGDAGNASSASPTSSSTPRAASADLTGTYRYKTGRYNNEFKVQQIAANQIKVQFSGSFEYKTTAGEAMANVGETDPQVVALDVATQTAGVLVPADAGDNCRIVLQFARAKLKVEQEGDCGFGLNVSATGDYTRNSATVKFASEEDAASAPPTTDAGQRLRFARGAYATTVAGSVKHDQEVVYLIDARAGQTIELKVTTDAPGNDVVFHLVGPGGSKPMADPKDEAGGYDNEWRGRLSRNGTYKIVVGTIESPQANFKLTVSIR